jgi:hypothetical protein
MNKGEVMRVNAWEPTTIEVETIDWKGREITLKDVPAEKSGKEVRVDLDDVIKAEQIQFASQLGLEPQNFHELLFLFASSKMFKGGFIETKFRFNKMLFYHWKGTEKLGFSNSFIYDSFVSARSGPIPINLKEDMIELQKKGIIGIVAIKNGKKIASGEKAIKECKPGISLGFELTSKGHSVAKHIWDYTPDEIKNLVVEIKQDLSFVDATQLKDKVHKDYPEYVKTYDKADNDEEFIQELCST